MAAAGAPPDRRSDVDFADVFGGPPRRSSGHDHQWQRRSSLDSSFGSVSRARSGPVFGERTSSDRGRLLGDEFYRDIFPGSESASPRRGAASGDWDVFGAPSSPGFRSRPRMSFSVKFTSGVDNPVPTSPSRHIYNRNDDGTSYAYSVPSSPNSSMNSFLAEGAPQQDSRKNPFSWHCYPFLSRFRSQSGEKKDTSQSHYVSSMDSECEGTPVSSESFIANNNFHFSFYKWEGKGALLMLLTPHKKAGNIIGVRSFPQMVVLGIDLIDEEDSMSTATGASKSQTDYEGYEPAKDGLFERKHSTKSTNKEGTIPLVFGDSMQCDKAEETGVLFFRMHVITETYLSGIGKFP